MNVFTRDIILTCRDNVIHPGMVSVDMDFIIGGGPVFLSGGVGKAGNGLYVFNSDLLRVAAFPLTGRVHFLGDIIVHRDGQLISEYSPLPDGLVFQAANGAYVAYVDLLGNFHTLTQVVNVPSLTSELPVDYAETVSIKAMLDSSLTYIIQGTDAAYPIFQILNNDICVLKLHQSGKLEIIGEVVRMRQEAAGAVRRIYGSYEGAGL